VKILKVEISKGTTNGEKITFYSDGDEAPGCQSGDVIVIVEEAPH